MRDTAALHNESMNRAELALLARMRKEHEKANQLFREALDLEIQAIEVHGSTIASEPTNSILHRSAATLALDCNEPRLAERIISKALSKEPPEEIAEELRDLLEQVHFRRHLLLRGITLDNDELQMSLAGQSVGLGVVHSQEFLQRIDDASKMIYRIVERKQNRPFRERGRVKQAVKDDYELFLSVPRAASFAITLKLGHPASQPSLPGISDVAEIVDEFMILMNLVNHNRQREIEEAIPDPAYRTNFLQLAKRLAPDGANVKLVGFTSIRQGKENFLEVTRRRGEFDAPSLTATVPEKISERVTVRGVLRFADATHKDGGQIRIIDEQASTTYQVKVPEGMMNDIVKPLWDSVVVIKGIRSGQFIILEDIEEQ